MAKTLSYSNIDTLSALVHLGRSSGFQPTYKSDIGVQEHLVWMGKVRRKLHPPCCNLMQTDGHGECDCNGDVSEGKNLVLYSGLYSIIDKLIDITNTNTTDGFITYLEVGMSNTAANPTQTALVAPKARKAMFTSARSATNALFNVFFNGAECNSVSTTVASATSSTQFTVQAGLGAQFAIGQLIEVNIAGLEYSTITNIATDTITVSPAFTMTPPVSATVKQAFAEVGMFGGSAATATLGSGIAFARSVSFSPASKDSGYGLTVEWHITFT